MSQIRGFWEEKWNFMQKSQEIGKHFRIRISLCISVKVCTVHGSKSFQRYNLWFQAK